MTAILFSDWQDIYPQAIVDDECPNISFLKYSQLLQEMGIKNHLWPIALIDRDLKGRNPHTATSLEEQLRWGMEFKLNPWAHFRYAARAPGSTEEYPNYFAASRANMAVFWLYFNHITTINIQPRQTGKTFGITSLDVYVNEVAAVGSRTILLTKDETLRSKTLGDFKVLDDLLPKFMQTRHKSDVANREEINISRLDNNIKALIARNDIAAADKTARGHTLGNTRTDEFAYLPFIRIALSVMLAATTAGRRLAEIRGNPYGNIMATTTSRKDDRDGGFAYEYTMAAAPWHEGFFDAVNREQLYSAVRGASKDGKHLRVNCTFNHRQLGYSDEWLRNTMLENNASGEDAERDYLNHWTAGSQLSPFTVEEAAVIRASQREVHCMPISSHGNIVTRWYIDEDRIESVMNSDHTIIGVDTSDAMGKDDLTITIRSLRTGEVYAAANINEMNIVTIVNFLVELLVKYRKSTMIIERRNQASSVIDAMHKQLISLGINPFTRMYNLCVQEAREKPERFKEINTQRNYTDEIFLAQHKKFFGFATSGSGSNSRSELYGNTLRNSVKYTAASMKDKVLIDQTLGLVYMNGRIDHPKGGHDDMCVSWLLGMWFMLMARNTEYYGIPPGYVLSGNPILHSVNTKKDAYELASQIKAKAQINALIERARNSRDSWVISHCAREIETLMTVNSLQEETIVTFNDMLEKIKKDGKAAYGMKRSAFSM